MLCLRKQRTPARRHRLTEAPPVDRHPPRFRSGRGPVGIARVRLLEMRPPCAAMARTARRGTSTATVIAVAVLWAARALTVPGAIRVGGDGENPGIQAIGGLT